MLKNSTLVGAFLLCALGVQPGFAQVSTPATSTGTVLSSYPTGFFTTVAATSTSTSPAIYAGMTANNNSCTGMLCDSCTGINSDITINGGSTTPPTTGNVTTCSVREIHPTDNFTVTLSSSFSGGVQSAPIWIQNGSGTSTQVIVNGTAAVFTGSSATVSIPWKLICSSLGNDANCTTSFPLSTMSIGWATSAPSSTTGWGETPASLQIAFRYVAQSPTWSTWCAPPFAGSYTSVDEGFCYFTAYPGDSKAYIFPTANTSNGYSVPDLEYSSTSSTSSADPSAMSYAGLAVFYSTNQSQFLTSAGHQVLNFSPSTGNLTPKYISGLSNGVPYYLFIGSVDQSGIVTFFSQPSAENFSTTVSPPNGNSQAVIPEPVEGLLNGKSCFIATAAYGSAMAPEVETFRQFRGQFLLNSKAGRWFVRKYYKFSPPLADFISHSEVLKFLARLFLFPLLIFVKACMEFGLLPTLLILSVSLLLILAYRRSAALPDGGDR
jgi:hypothetical protein